MQQTGVDYLLVNDCPETGLALDDGVRNTHLAAQGRQVDDQLNGVNIVWDENQGGLLVLDEGNNMVEAVLDGVGLF